MRRHVCALNTATRSWISCYASETYRIIKLKLALSKHLFTPRNRSGDCLFLKADAKGTLRNKVFVYWHEVNPRTRKEIDKVLKSLN